MNTQFSFGIALRKMLMKYAFVLKLIKVRNDREHHQSTFNHIHELDI